MSSNTSTSVQTASALETSLEAAQLRDRLKSNYTIDDMQDMYKEHFEDVDSMHYRTVVHKRPSDPPRRIPLVSAGPPLLLRANRVNRVRVGMTCLQL